MIDFREEDNGCNYNPVMQISVFRFEELVYAEATLEIVRRAYECCDGYKLADALKVVFGGKEDNHNA